MVGASKKSIALLILLATLWIPADAVSAPFTPKYEDFYNDALVYWDRTPECSEVKKEIVPKETMIEVHGSYVYGLSFKCEIWVVQGLEPCVGRQVVYHEVGHQIGLEHNSDPHSIMNPTEAFPQFCRLEPPGKPWETRKRKMNVSRSFKVKE